MPAGVIDLASQYSEPGTEQAFRRAHRLNSFSPISIDIAHSGSVTKYSRIENV
jgi:hypothetical protein